MRIIQLEADAFKRLRAISITPTTNIVEVTGDNGEGKTSTLDAIWAALEAYAAEHDLQVWVETVSQHGQAAVLIEDGGVVTPLSEIGDVV